MTANFLIAKHIPELHRMEPRNFGVIVWYRGRVRHRFLPASEATFASNKEVYASRVKQWIHIIESGQVTPPRSQMVPLSSPEFLAAMRTMQDDDYLLLDGGFLTEKISIKELPQVTDFLFSEMVAPLPEPLHHRQNAFAEACKRMLRDSGLCDRVVKDYTVPVPCDVFGVTKQLRFNYGSGDDHPVTVLQRVHLEREASVHDAALKIGCLTKSGQIDRNRCGVIVMTDQDVERHGHGDGGIGDNLDLLNSVGVVINLSDYDRAVSVARTLLPPASNGTSTAFLLHP